MVIFNTSELQVRPICYDRRRALSSRRGLEDSTTGREYDLAFLSPIGEEELVGSRGFIAESVLSIADEMQKTYEPEN